MGLTTLIPKRPTRLSFNPLGLLQAKTYRCRLSQVVNPLAPRPFLEEKCFSNKF